MDEVLRFDQDDRFGFGYPLRLLSNFNSFVHLEASSKIKLFLKNE